MKAPISKQTAEARVVRKYQRLYKPLIELVDSLQNLEPGGTLVDDVVLNKKEEGGIRITYVAKPVMLTIKAENRIFTLRIIENVK